MKISEQEIVRMTQELRDEENEQLHVRPWSRKRHSPFPAWLAAIPAAAVVGFFLGIWTNRHLQPDDSLAAIVDTVYIKVKESPTDTATMQPAPPSVAPQTASVAHPAPSVRRTVKKVPDEPVGQPMTNDQIRYDLLVKN